MLITLLETRNRRARSPREAALSLGVHALLISAAVAVTANTHAPTARAGPVDTLVFVAPTTVPPVVERASPAAPPASPSPQQPPVINVIIAPPDIPTGLPAVPSPNAFEPAVPATATASGTPGAIANPDGTNGSFTAWQVEKPALALAGAIPSYPDMLRASGIEGEVVVQFVVDTLGRVEAGSLRVVSATHVLFAQSVERVLPRLRFVPAEAAGRRVRQLVQQPFQFAMTR